MAAADPLMILGERPAAEAPLYDPNEERNTSAWAAGPPVQRVALTALAAAVQGSAGQTATIAEADLPESLRCRTALQVLARRAHRSGKQVALGQCSPELRAIAGAAGWNTGNTGSTHVAALAAGVSHSGRAFGSGGRQVGVVAREKAPTRGHSSPASGMVSHAYPATRTSSALQSLRLRTLGLAGTGAGRVTARSRGRRASRRVQPMAALAGFAVVAIVALGALLVPSATVTLTPAIEQVTFDLPMVVDPAIKKPDVARGRLPGRAINKEITETAQAPATGRKASPDGRATGEVVFVNKTDKAVVVPKGTIVLAGGVRFATQADLNVGGTVFTGPQQRISMQRTPVQALNGGADGNVGRFQVNKIEGPLASQLDVQNDAATRGGSEKTVAFVTADDRRKLQESLTRNLLDRLSQQLKSQLPSPDKETAVSWGAQNPAVVEATFSKNEGDEAQTLSLTVTVRYSATVFSNDGYNAFVKQFAGAKIGELKPGFDLDSAGVVVLAPEVQGLENGVVRLLAHAKGTASPHVDAGTLRAALANRPLVQARSYLDTMPGVAHADLRAWPGWLGRTPPVGLRIALHTTATTATTAPAT